MKRLSSLRTTRRGAVLSKCCGQRYTVEMVGISGGGSASGGISRTCPKRSCRRASDSPRVPCEAPSRCCCAASLPLSRLEGTARLHAAAHSGRSRVAPRARWSADTRSQRSSRCRQSQQKTARQGPLWGLPSLGLPSRPTRRRRHARQSESATAQARFHGTVPRAPRGSRAHLCGGFPDIFWSREF